MPAGSVLPGIETGPLNVTIVGAVRGLRCRSSRAEQQRGACNRGYCSHSTHQYSSLGLVFISMGSRKSVHAAYPSSCRLSRRGTSLLRMRKRKSQSPAPARPGTGRHDLGGAGAPERLHLRGGRKLRARQLGRPDVHHREPDRAARPQLGDRVVGVDYGAFAGTGILLPGCRTCSTSAFSGRTLVPTMSSTSSFTRQTRCCCSSCCGGRRAPPAAAPSWPRSSPRIRSTWNRSRG